MKQAMAVQTSVCEDFRTVTADLNQRLCMIEQPDSGGGEVSSRGVESVAWESGALGREGVVAPRIDVEVLSWDEESVALTFGAHILVGGAAERAPSAERSGWAAVSPAWNRVVKEGRRLKHVTGNVPIQSKRRLNPPREKKTSGIVGTGAGGNMQVVKTKLVSVFATKFSPDLDSETLANYLKNKLNHDVTCQKIATAHSRYSSFKITAECNEVGEMYDPQVWPKGTFVRRVYEARKPRANTGPVDVKTLATTRNVPEAGVSAAV